jgi:murein DD-endopeptidase MepM/ murein hydrolase activator NlpD
VVVPDAYTPPDPTYITREVRGERRQVRCPEEIRFHDGFLDDRDFQTPGVQEHNGIDIAGGVGLLVLATTHGKVLNSWRFFRGTRVPGSGCSERGGNYVVMLDWNGYVHYYAHMRDYPLVDPGNSIRAGDQLGWLGRTGRAAGTGSCPHLHYQVYRPTRVEEGLDLEARFFLPENPYAELVRVQAIPGP